MNEWCKCEGLTSDVAPLSVDILQPCTKHLSATIGGCSYRQRPQRRLHPVSEMLLTPLSCQHTRKHEQSAVIQKQAYIKLNIYRCVGVYSEAACPLGLYITPGGGGHIYNYCTKIIWGIFVCCFILWAFEVTNRPGEQRKYILSTPDIQSIFMIQMLNLLMKRRQTIVDFSIFLFWPILIITSLTARLGLVASYK
jgi:hypothetical protein